MFQRSVSINHRDRTNGVEVMRTERHYWGRHDLQLVFLDFGGHTIYNAGQEFFLSESNAMAVVLLSPLEVESHAGDLPSNPQKSSFCVVPGLTLSSAADTHTFRRFRKPSQEEAYPRMRRELVHWLTMLQSRRKV